MDNNATEFSGLSLEQRREFCRQKIDRHSPPVSRHDKFMIRIYQNLFNLYDEAIVKGNNADFKKFRGAA